jgi:hypothetical protein
MSPFWIQFIVIAVLVVLAIIFYARSGGKITPERLAEIARMGVMAAEQYKASGKIFTNDEQLRFAIDFVKRYFDEFFPGAAAHIPDELIIDAIHAFVPEANALTAQISEVWKHPTEPAKLIVTPSTPPTHIGPTGLQ